MSGQSTGLSSSYLGLFIHPPGFLSTYPHSYLTTHLATCLSVSQSVHAAICLSIHPTTLSVYLPVYPSVHTSTHSLHVCLPVTSVRPSPHNICPPTFPMICIHPPPSLPACLSVFPPICAATSLSIHQSVHPSTCLPAILSYNLLSQRRNRDTLRSVVMRHSLICCCAVSL